MQTKPTVGPGCPSSVELTLNVNSLFSCLVG